jgi:RNase H-like domain found in reverse transcriptase
VVQRMKYSGGTFSGKKLLLCTERFWVVGHCCTSEGRVVDESRVAPIRNWTICMNKSEVRSFLGTIGILRIFIRNFAHRAHHLVKLTRKDIPWEWTADQQGAMEDLQGALISLPALRPLDYESDLPVILAVDTFYIAVGYFLCQCKSEDIKRQNYSRFGSITLNEREAHFSQAKLEIYGLFRALRAVRLWIIGVRKLVMETDVRYIKGMLANLDIQPSVSINQ